jgi:hypothetical protein
MNLRDPLPLNAEFIACKIISCRMSFRKKGVIDVFLCPAPLTLELLYFRVTLHDLMPMRSSTPQIAKCSGVSSQGITVSTIAFIRRLDCS